MYSASLPSGSLFDKETKPNVTSLLPVPRTPGSSSEGVPRNVDMDINVRHGARSRSGATIPCRWTASKQGP